MRRELDQQWKFSHFQRNEPITPGTLCDIFFHANDIRRFALTGEQIRNILQHSLELRNKNEDEGHGEFLQVGGLSIRVVGRDITEIVATGGGQPFDLARRYSVATTTFLSKKCSEFSKFFDGQDGDILDGSVEAAVTRAKPDGCSNQCAR